MAWHSRRSLASAFRDTQCRCKVSARRDDLHRGRLIPRIQRQLV